MKEDIRPKDGKRKLYFSLDMQNFITYTLDQKTTCEKIFEINKNSINSKFAKLYNNSNIDLNDFEFYLIDLKEIIKSKGNFVSRIKLNRNVIIYNFLQNPKTILCFMPKLPINQDHSIKRIDEDKSHFTNQQYEDMKKNYLNGKQIDNFYINKTIFVYDFVHKIYNKLKANLSLKQFTIHTKPETIIHIQDITSINYCDVKHPLIENLIVKSGFKPPIYIVLKTDENQWMIGLKTEDKIKRWKIGFDYVLFNLNFFRNDISFNIELNNLKEMITQKEEKIITEPINIENFINNKYRKILLYRYIKDKKILELIINILLYKKFVLSNDTNNAIEKLNDIIEKNKEENKNKKSNISEILTSEKISKYKELYDKAQEIIKSENKEPLKDLLKPDLFDNIFDELNKIEINPFLEKFNKEISEYIEAPDESNIKNDMEMLISYNCFKNYKMENLESFLELNI